MGTGRLYPPKGVKPFVAPSFTPSGFAPLGQLVPPKGVKPIGRRQSEPKGERSPLRGQLRFRFAVCNCAPKGTTTSLLFPSGLLLPFVAPSFTPSGFAPLGQRTAKRTEGERTVGGLHSFVPKGIKIRPLGNRKGLLCKQNKGTTTRLLYICFYP